jgi:hypothetical protein
VARSLGDKLLLAKVLCLVAKSSAENASTPGQEALQMYQGMGLKDKARAGMVGRVGMQDGWLRWI